MPGACLRVLSCLHPTDGYSAVDRRECRPRGSDPAGEASEKESLKVSGCGQVSREVVCPGVTWRGAQARFGLGPGVGLTCRVVGLGDPFGVWPFCLGNLTSEPACGCRWLKTRSHWEGGGPGQRAHLHPPLHGLASRAAPAICSVPTLPLRAPLVQLPRPSGLSSHAPRLSPCPADQPSPNSPARTNLLCSASNALLPTALQPDPGRKVPPPGPSRPAVRLVDAVGDAKPQPVDSWV